ncbi:MAG: type II secretion system F family protein [Phycisphaerae bacterium]
MKLAYKAYDSLGKAVTGTIECADVTAATETLRRNGLYLAEVAEAGDPSREKWRLGTPVSPVATSKSRPTKKFRTSQKIKNLAVFSRQLCVLISSGTQLPEVLSALERQTKPGPWRYTISDLRSKVEQGVSLSEAMEAHPQYFDSIYYGLIAAGESTGGLVEMLDRLATLKQKQLRVRSAVVGALIYPSLLVVLTSGIFSLLLLFVVPRFAMLFDVLDVPLPASTQALVDISHAFRSYWWAAGLFVVGTVVSVYFYLRTPDGNRFRDTAILRLPYIGSITKSLATARIVRLLGVLMAGHVPVLKVLELIRHAAGNINYAELICKAEEHVTKGELISLAFCDANLISPSVHEVIRSGEQSGQLSRLSLNIADFLDDENEVTIRSLTSIMEPVILIVMGILVGLVALSMFMPLFDLTSMAQGGGL